MKFSTLAIAAATLNSGVSGFSVNQGRFAVRSVSSFVIALFSLHLL